MVDQQLDQNGKENRRQDRYKIFFFAAMIATAAGHILSPKTVDQFVATLIILSLSPWLVPFFSKYVTSVNLFGAKIDLLTNQMDTQKERLDALYLLSMSDKVFLYLVKLKTGDFGPFYVSPAMPRELAFLEELGYIEFKGNLKGVEDFVNRFKDKPDGGNLSDYIGLTDAGLAFYNRTIAIKPATGRV